MENLILKLTFDSNVDLYLIIWQLRGIFVSRGLGMGMGGQKPHAEATKQKFHINLCLQKKKKFTKLAPESSLSKPIYFEIWIMNLTTS